MRGAGAGVGQVLPCRVYTKWGGPDRVGVFLAGFPDVSSTILPTIFSVAQEMCKHCILVSRGRK